MENAFLFPAEQWNCSVDVVGDQGVQLLTVRIENGTMPQNWPERNSAFDTDRSGEIASCLISVGSADTAMAVYQHKSWWIRPAFPRLPAQVPERTQLLLWKGKNGFHVLLAVCDAVIRADFAGSDRGIILSLSSNGCAVDSDSHTVACYMHGADPYECIHRMVSTVCRLQGREHILRENKQFPELFRGLGWCTWDSFYHKVNEADILRTLREFREKSVPISWMLIDDGWSDADYATRKLNELTADTVKFPSGIAGCVKTAKEEFGIGKVGVWHAMMGYWTGLNPGSPIFEAWKDRLILRNENDYVLQPDEDVIYDFYDQWHSWMERCGVDFVKVDGQGSGSLYYKELAHFGSSAGSYHRALERSTGKHFQGNLINCMGMASENMWLREHSTVSRSSDDFVPEVEHGFREHALQNSFNSLLQGQFFWGDWDMFWSDHVENRQNSVLRCVSGGPVYVSDQLGQTDPAYILPLLGWDNRVILCEQTGVPTMDCLLRDPLHEDGLLKIFNRYADSYSVAAFNILERETTCRDCLTTAEVPGLCHREWVVYRHFAKKCEILRGDSPVELELEANDAEHLILLPKKPFGQFLGDPDKYISCYAVIQEQADEHCLRGTLCSAETIAFVTDAPVIRVLLNGDEVPFQVRDGFCQVLCGTDRNSTIEIYY